MLRKLTYKDYDFLDVIITQRDLRAAKICRDAGLCVPEICPVAQGLKRAFDLPEVEVGRGSVDILERCGPSKNPIKHPYNLSFTGRLLVFLFDIRLLHHMPPVKVRLRKEVPTT